MATEILIVDDDDAIRESMQEFLEVSGYSTTAVKSAEEALKQLVTKKVQVVITDIMLPGMDGLELTDAIKADKEVEINVMTVYTADYT